MVRTKTTKILGLEEEEYTSIYKTGFRSSQDDDKSKNNKTSRCYSRCPYKPNSKKCQAWNNGYNDYFLSDMVFN